MHVYDNDLLNVNYIIFILKIALVITVIAFTIVLSLHTKCNSNFGSKSECTAPYILQQSLNWIYSYLFH